DPIWHIGSVTTAAPPRASFPLAKWRAPIPMDAGLPAEEGSDLPPGDFPHENLVNPTLPDSPAAKLNVAPHAVGYDATRRLWYADIVIRPATAYFPFVRLALARYCPVSVPGAHLSPVILTEFLQLAPDRLALVTHGVSAGKATVAVHGTGMGSKATTLPRI